MIQCSEDSKNEQRERNHNLTREDFDSVFEFEVCKEDPVTMFEMCIKEVRETTTCIGFVQREAKLYFQDEIVKQNVSDIPQCLQSFLSNNGPCAKPAPTTMTIFAVFATMWWMNFHWSKKLSMMTEKLTISFLNSCAFSKIEK